MKLRAPRCSDSTSLMSAPECGKASPSSAEAMPAAAPMAMSETAISTKRLCMSRHPLRHRLHAVELGVPGHQQKERKIKSRANLRQGRINARRRLQPAHAQDDERHRKNGQRYFVKRSAIANREHRGTI